MAIDDNASYELTGAQVKDLANKIKAKAADNIFVGATSVAPGSKGLVPQPQAGDDTKFLKGDGTWGLAGGASVTTIYMSDDGSKFQGSIFNNMMFPSGGFAFSSTPITGNNTALSLSDISAILASGCPIRVEGAIAQDGYTPSHGIITCYYTSSNTCRVRLEYMGVNQLFSGIALSASGQIDPGTGGVRWGWMQ